MGRLVRVVFVLLALVCAATVDPSVGARQGHRLSSGPLRAARGDRVVVEVFHTLSDAQARRGVERAGGRVSGLVPGVLVQADVPVRNLATLESTSGITFIRPPRRINVVPADADGPSAGNRRRGRGGLVGQEVTKTNAAAWQAAGQRAGGVKIGIVDLFSRKKYSKAQRRKQVPTPAGTVCFFQGAPCDVFSVSDPHEAHGTAVAEVVHEMAPDAQLFLATAVTAADLQLVVNTFVAQGVKIVTRSLTSEYDGPGDGQGPVGAVIDSAVAGGITWFNSAGNSAGNGVFPRSGAYYRGTFTDTNGNGFHEFAPGAETLGLPCFVFTHGLRWDDFNEATANVTDFDLVEVDAAGNVLDVAEDRQGSAGGTAPPLENFAQGGTTCSEFGSQPIVFIGIRLIAPGSGANDVIEFQNNGGPMTFSSNPFSAAVPACDSKNPGLVCVGAIDPPLGVQIASYSSQGPTNDGRIKPDVSIASCVKTISFKACFNGTSAASPAAAGAAALMLGAGLGGGTPAGLGDLVRATVVDRGAPGPDNLFGTGEVILPAPP
jgi:hypothetical protein